MKLPCLKNKEASYFDTRQITSTQRCDYWQDAISQVFVPLDSKVESSDNFWGALELRHCSHLDIVRVQGASQYVTRGRQQIRRSPEDRVLMSFMLKGNMGLAHNGKEIQLTTGQFAFYDTDEEYQLNLNTAFDQVVIAIPKSNFENILGKPKDLCGFNFGEQHPLQIFYQGCLKDIFTTPMDLSLRQQEVLSDHLLNMMKCIVADEYPRKTNYLFEQIKVFVLAQLDNSDLTIHHVAKKFNISTRYISKLFQKNDMTFSYFLLNARLDKARKNLQSTPYTMCSIKHIAYNVGFNDISYFSRAFKKRFGITASEVRA